MITTDIDTEEQKLITAIKRSICYDTTVHVYDEECNHPHTTEWVDTFCEEVGYAVENGGRRVWGEFHGQEFSIFLTALI